MKIRLNIHRMVMPDGSMSRRERTALGTHMGRELGRLLEQGATATGDPQRHSAPSIATDIAAAIAAHLPPPRGPQPTGRRT
jgi:hypothetical protein